MRRPRIFIIAAGLLVAGVLATGCTKHTPSLPPVDQSPNPPLPPSSYTLDGKPTQFEYDSQIKLRYSSYDGYLNQANSDKAGDTLDALLPGPRKMASPYVVDFDRLEPKIRSNPDVTQRAISVTMQKVAAGEPLNLLPSRFSFMPKPEGAKPTSESVDENYGSVDDYTFANAYIEKRGKSTQVVLVTANGFANAQKPYDSTDRFYSVRGVTGYNQPFKSTLPGEREVTKIRWSAQLFSTDCKAVRVYRDRYSSSCGFIRRGDNLPYDKHANVILVAPVKSLEWRDHYKNQGEPAHSSGQQWYVTPLTRDGSRFVTAVSNSGWPYSAPPLDPPVSDTFASLIAEGANVIGSNDILKWPAYSVLDK